MQDQIETIGMLLVKGVLLPIVGLAITIASLWLPTWIKSKVKNESVAGVLERLSTLAFTVVSEIQQTVIANLGNKATAEELLKARDQAIATLKSHLGEKGLKELMTALGLADTAAVDKLLVTFIESAVHHLPQTTSSAVVETKTVTTPETAAAPATTAVTTTAATSTPT